MKDPGHRVPKTMSSHTWNVATHRAAESGAEFNVGSVVTQQADQAALQLDSVGTEDAGLIG